MNRRDFLRTMVAGGVALAGGAVLAKGGIGAEAQPPKVLSGITIIDAHAHPDMWAAWDDRSASYRYMETINMAASSFSAVGDRVYRNRRLGTSAFKFTKEQLGWWLDGIVKEHKVRAVLKAADIPLQSGKGQPPGAILSIEGGDALEGKLENIDEFYKMGVRLITVIHERNNEIGDTMQTDPHMDMGTFRGRLSTFGHEMIARMEAMGMVVDVAHAHPATFREILAAATKPLIDSHTNPSPTEEAANNSRMRTWKEMELVAKNGGVVCTWPHRYIKMPRWTIADWAKEILLMKQNIGIEHVGLGTDGGGNSLYLEGYHDERDLEKLGAAMLEVGLSKEDIAAYMGGNLLRVFTACIV